MNMRRILLFCFLVFSSQFVFGNGYQVLLQGNKEVAMGNTGVGVKPSATSVFFNPGAMGFMEQSEVYLGASVVFGKVNYSPFNSVDQYENRSTVPVPSLYAVYAPDSSSSLSDFRFGLGVFAPFGSVVDWEEGWAGRRAVEHLTLVAIYVQPTVSYRINDWLSVGAGLDILASGHVKLERKTEILGQEGDVTLDGNAETKLGFNLGIFAMPSEKFSVGINYRSKIDATIESGDASFEGFSTPTQSAALLSTGVPLPTTFDASIPLPSVLTLGVGLYPNEKWTIAADIAYVGWSEYDSLNFIFDGNPNSAYSKGASNTRDWDNSFVFHFGLEYKVSPIIAARAGIYYDQSPVKDNYLSAETPDANAVGYTTGLGIKLGENFDLDLSMLFLDKEQRTNTVPTTQDGRVQTGGINGTFNVNAIIPGFGLKYKF